MSFRPPRCVRHPARRTQNIPQDSQTSQKSHIIPVQDAPRSRLAQGTSHLQLPRVQPLFAMPGDRNYTQLVTQTSRDQSSLSHQHCGVQDEHDVAQCSGPDDIPHPHEQTVHMRSERARRKREKQYATWMNIVIPSLLKPYM